VLSWHSAWSWAGGQYSVKSYPNVVVDTQDVPLSKIKSIDTTWKWSYTGQSLVTNVAYDVFTSSTVGGAEEYELMVWLGNFNAGPIARYVSIALSPFLVQPSLTLFSPAHGAPTANLSPSQPASNSPARLGTCTKARTAR
jgi:xyloglucan-specific endo-beta-1,4-glucanase